MSNVEIVATGEVLGGEPRIKGTRIGVSHVVQYYEIGWSVDKISRELRLEPLQVLKALEYYYRNPSLIRSLIKGREHGISKDAGERA